MAYTIRGLNSSAFTHLFGQDENYLARHLARRMRADKNSGFPDRIALRDVPEGEYAILINHAYQPAETPYFGRHAIFIHEGCTSQGVYQDEVPPYLTTRLLSLRAFNTAHMIIAAEVTPGSEAEGVIFQMLRQPETAYIHVHSARFGCYLCVIERS